MWTKTELLWMIKNYDPSRDMTLEFFYEIIRAHNQTLYRAIAESGNIPLIADFVTGVKQYSVTHAMYPNLNYVNDVFYYCTDDTVEKYFGSLKQSNTEECDDQWWYFVHKDNIMSMARLKMILNHFEDPLNKCQIIISSGCEDVGGHNADNVVDTAIAASDNTVSGLFKMELEKLRKTDGVDDDQDAGRMGGALSTPIEDIYASLARTFRFDLLSIAIDMFPRGCKYFDYEQLVIKTFKPERFGEFLKISSLDPEKTRTKLAIIHHYDDSGIFRIGGIDKAITDYLAENDISVYPFLTYALDQTKTDDAGLFEYWLDKYLGKCRTGAYKDVCAFGNQLSSYVLCGDAVNCFEYMYEKYWRDVDKGVIMKAIDSDKSAKCRAFLADH